MYIQDRRFRSLKYSLIIAMLAMGSACAPSLQGEWHGPLSAATPVGGTPLGTVDMTVAANNLGTITMDFEAKGRLNATCKGSVEGLTFKGTCDVPCTGTSVDQCGPQTIEALFERTKEGDFTSVPVFVRDGKKSTASSFVFLLRPRAKVAP